ncbi:hypothetical protein B0H13DRAFT_2286387 [Mycena leptocephala]|nr:hypothetical protein B0H13DRAFT_2286387 [Mycena leptocephala]
MSALIKNRKEVRGTSASLRRIGGSRRQRQYSAVAKPNKTQKRKTQKGDYTVEKPPGSESYNGFDAASQISGWTSDGELRGCGGIYLEIDPGLKAETEGAFGAWGAVKRAESEWQSSAHRPNSS